MATVLIAGGTGLIGKRLSLLLAKKNHEVILLSRKKDLSVSPPRYKWDLNKQFIEEEAIKRADYVMNLAGTGIADKRWSDKRKKEIIDSRIDSTRLLLKGFKTMEKKPKMYLAATAIGYYGERGAEWVDENAEPGQEGFMPRVCVQWENTAEEFAQWQVPTTVIRVGIVLSTKGGALQKMLPSYKLRSGAYFGSGTQYYSWIHIDDLCRIFVAAIENNYTGVLNGVAPYPVTNKQMAKDIATALNKIALVAPIPEFALRLAMGEMADIVLVGSRVSSEKVQNLGFQFLFPKLIPAIQDLVKRKI